MLKLFNFFVFHCANYHVGLLFRLCRLKIKWKTPLIFWTSLGFYTLPWLWLLLYTLSSGFLATLNLVPLYTEVSRSTCLKMNRKYFFSPIRTFFFFKGKWIILNFVFSLAQTVKILIALAIFFTYALQFYVPTTIIWEMIQHRFAKERQSFYNYVLRMVTVTGTGE